MNRFINHGTQSQSVPSQKSNSFSISNVVAAGRGRQIKQIETTKQFHAR